MLKRPLTILTLGACLTFSCAGVATAAGLPPAVVDCHAHSTLTRHYSPTQLRVALALMPPDITQYTDCYSVIQRQLLIEIGALKLSGSASGGSGGSFLPVPVLIAIIALALGAATFGVLALRKRRSRGEAAP